MCVLVRAPARPRLGSRQQYKWVMEYDSYEFVSKSWKCHEIFFCKLDTWLDGVLQPAHPELWQGSSKAAPSLKRSVFHVPEEQQEAQVDGGSAGAPVAGAGEGRCAAGAAAPLEEPLEEDYELEGVAESDSDQDSDASEAEEAEPADGQLQ